jgi:threonylcarbamoyladenosine tRNA methylthiotransferase MtaB
LGALTYAITTLGCKVNQYDTAIIESRLRARGMERREFDEPADVYIVNTCTVTDRADAESLRLARRARRLNAAARIVMTGCLAQADPARLAKAREVDAVVGLGRGDDLERAVLHGGVERVTVSNLRRERAPIELGGVALTGHTRAFLKLQEGCDQFCSFCVVPISRGTSRSVEPRRVIDALDELAERGFKEVTLSGVHLGGYGRDLDPPVRLEALLEMIAERAPFGRIRLSSLDPEELSDAALGIVSGSRKFCAHLHLPLQAGSDRVLVRMRRRYDTAFYRDLVARVVGAWPDVAVGTDVIVGFPGEEAGDFEQSLRFVESLPFAYLHVFPYSVRTGTTAAKLAGRASPAEITRRARLMREVGEEKRRAFVERHLGARLEVLLEERLTDGRLRGLSRNYLRVLTSAGAGEPNQICEVEARVVEGTALSGQIAADWRPAPAGAAAN